GGGAVRAEGAHQPPGRVGRLDLLVGPRDGRGAVTGRGVVVEGDAVGAGDGHDRDGHGGGPRDGGAEGTRHVVVDDDTRGTGVHGVDGLDVEGAGATLDEGDVALDGRRHVRRQRGAGLGLD